MSKATKKPTAGRCFQLTMVHSFCRYFHLSDTLTFCGLLNVKNKKTINSRK